MDIRELLEKADKKLFKVRSVDPDCPLSNIIPKKKETNYLPRKTSAHRPDTKTDRFKNVFVNRIRHNLWSFFSLYTVCLMYFYLFICIQYVLCIFRFSTAEVTEDMSFYRRRIHIFIFRWKTERETKTAIFLETRSCSLWRLLISFNQNAEWEERAGKRERTNFDCSFFYILISFFYWILLEKRFYAVWISFSCAQPILIAWTSCLKLIISKIYLRWLRRRKQLQPLWMKKYINLQ